MPDRDTMQALIEEVAALVTGDDEMQTIAGTPVRFCHVWAAQDSEFPYFVSQAALHPDIEDALQVADLRIDVWDEGSDQLRLFAMRGRLIELLHKRTIPAAEFRTACYFAGDFDLSQPEVEVWRRCLSFTVRLYPITEIAAMQAR